MEELLKILNEATNPMKLRETVEALEKTGMSSEDASMMMLRAVKDHIVAINYDYTVSVV